MMNGGTFSYSNGKASVIALCDGTISVEIKGVEAYSSSITCGGWACYFMRRIACLMKSKG